MLRPRPENDLDLDLDLSRDEEPAFRRGRDLLLLVDFCLRDFSPLECDLLLTRADLFRRRDGDLELDAFPALGFDGEHSSRLTSGS